MARPCSEYSLTLKLELEIAPKRHRPAVGKRSHVRKMRMARLQQFFSRRLQRPGRPRRQWRTGKNKRLHEDTSKASISSAKNITAS